MKAAPGRSTTEGATFSTLPLISYIEMWPVVSTGRTTHAQGCRPSLVGPVLVGFQASLALLSNQALRRDAAVLNSRYTAPILGVGATILG